VAENGPIPQTISGATYSASGGAEVALAMDIQSLFAIGQNNIPALVEMLVEALGTINDALNALNIAWAGDAKNAAQDINDRWQACATAMFGSQKTPELGVLNRIGSGILSAASNYDLAETSLIQLYTLYNQMLTDLQQGTTPPPPPPPPPGSPSTVPPIIEVTP
jgi:hypothetical protein